MGFFVYSFAKTCFTDRENEICRASPIFRKCGLFSKEEFNYEVYAPFVPHTPVYDCNVKAIFGPRHRFFYKNSADIHIFDHFRKRRWIFRKPGAWHLRPCISSLTPR
jgi:hypothetical protein